MQEVKFTIIIPIYNAETFLSRSVESVFSQDYKSYEVILVNDGSTDNTDRLCRQYVQKNKQIQYLYKENGGPASARNQGILAAKGDYIIFLDSDDRLYEHILYDLNQIIHGKEHDIYFGTYASYYEKQNKAAIEPFHFNTELIKEGQPLHILNNLFLYNSVIFSVWRHAFRRELIMSNHIFFDESLYGPEDCDFMIKIILCAKTFAAAAIPFCYYTTNRKGSIMTNPKPKTVKSQFELSIHWFHYFFDMHASSKEPYVMNLVERFANVFCGTIMISGSLPKSEKTAFEKIAKENEDILRYLKGYRYMVLKRVYFLFNYHTASYMMFQIQKLHRFCRRYLGGIWKSSYQKEKEGES